MSAKDTYIWRDIDNNKVYVKCGTETIEVPHVIAKAYEQDEAQNFHYLNTMIDKLLTENSNLRRSLAHENVKLRVLIYLLIEGMENDMTPAERLIWSQKVNELIRELGIEEK